MWALFFLSIIVIEILARNFPEKAVYTMHCPKSGHELTTVSIG